jgi:hypothetical protein
MIIEHLILARDSAVDRDKNTLSVFDFIEEVQFEVPPAAKLQFPVQVIAVIRREGSEVGEIRTNFVLSILDPKNRQISKNDIPVVMSAQHTRQRVRIGAGVLATESGDYTFRFEKGDNNSVARELPLKVTVIPKIS